MNGNDPISKRTRRWAEADAQRIAAEREAQAWHRALESAAIISEVSPTSSASEIVEAVLERDQALRERVDKFMWQVRDTCRRAEKAEKTRDHYGLVLRMIREGCSSPQKMAAEALDSDALRGEPPNVEQGAEEGVMTDCYDDRHHEPRTGRFMFFEPRQRQQSAPASSADPEPVYDDSSSDPLSEGAAMSREPPWQIVRVRELEAAISGTAAQLERWADESRNGGWSTHQVDPMRRKARELRALAGEEGR